MIIFHFTTATPLKIKRNQFRTRLRALRFFFRLRVCSAHVLRARRRLHHMSCTHVVCTCDVACATIASQAARLGIVARAPPAGGGARGRGASGSQRRLRRGRRPRRGGDTPRSPNTAAATLRQTTRPDRITSRAAVPGGAAADRGPGPGAGALRVRATRFQGNEVSKSVFWGKRFPSRMGSRIEISG